VSREGSLDAPTRHPLGQNQRRFFDGELLTKELERVFEICHGCRRCFNLCESFPTLFDLVDESETMEVDGVDSGDYDKVIDHCFQCDMCYQTKCPYVPPHEWNVDFPHLMLRAKAVKFRKQETRFRDRLITSTDLMGAVISTPGIAQAANAFNRMAPFRKLLDSVLQIHPDASLPHYQSRTLEKRTKRHHPADVKVKATEQTRGRVALFATCYGNYNVPDLGEDFIQVFEHNEIPVKLIRNAHCCGMPKYELGDLDAVEQLKSHNIPLLVRLIDEGYDLVSLVPSCTLMFKQELPLMFPDESRVKKVQQAMFDPFEYLMLRHKEGLLNLNFNHSLGKIAYQVACHQRVQNIGMKTRELLQLIPDTEVIPIERCSGHDGTYTFKSEKHASAMKILKPVVSKVRESGAAHYTSDCAMAGTHIEHGLADGSKATHPISLLKAAYDL
jgi:glycerol-3-phosphate dehydrogenase subunit C